MSVRSRQRSGQVNKAIAYVEDDDLIRENYAELLGESGFEVTTYSNPKDALAAFSQKMPHLVLLDITLGRERDAGFQLCSDIRKLSSTVQIVFLTSHDGEIDKVSGLRLGADDYLTKDVSIDYIVVRLEALFRRLEALGVRSEEPVDTKTSLQPESDLEDILLDRYCSQVGYPLSRIQVHTKRILTKVLFQPGVWKRQYHKTARLV